jgi:hypothetical protein
MRNREEMFSMRTLSTLLYAAGIAALVSFAGATSASAISLGAMQKTSAGAGAAGQVETVDYRDGYRHCHWRGGRKWCHGGVSRYDNGYRYGYRPGITLRFGLGDRGYRHNRRNYWR